MDQKQQPEATGKDGQRPTLPLDSSACDGVNKQQRLPRMSKHSSGQARVRFPGGQTRYLGAFGSIEAHARYAELMREWLANGKQPLGERAPHASALSYTVGNLLTDYFAWLDQTGRFTKAGKPTSHRKLVKLVLDRFEAFAGAVPVRRLTSHLLVQWRDRIEAEHPDMIRGSINRHVSLVVTALAWGEDRGTVPTATRQSCAAIRPLKLGSCGARPEHKRARRAISQQEVEGVIAHCPARIGSLMRLQLVSAMRPGEARAIRWCDVSKDGSQGTWTYHVPGGGKTVHHQRRIKYYLGREAQRILNEQPACLPTVPIFGALSDSAYSQAIARACKKAGVAHFSPHECRHSALSRVAEQAGIAAASAAAGHASIATTARYVHKDDAQALAAVAVLDRVLSG
jgi:integrase